MDSLNYKDNVDGISMLGSWTPCSSGDSCGWSERWREVLGVSFTYSTADNSRPLERELPGVMAVTAVRIGVLLPMFVGTFSPLWAVSSRSATHMAMLELNNKSDGIADHLLPDTRLEFAFADPKCESQYGLLSALQMVEGAFNGMGVSAVVGTGCSVSSVTAAQVTQLVHVPMIDTGGTSPSLSDGKGYPYYGRTVPSSSFRAQSIVDILQHLFSYTQFAVVWTKANFGDDVWYTIHRTAASHQLNAIGIQIFDTDRSAIQAYAQIRSSGTRVVVLILSVQATKDFIRSAGSNNIGSGYFWFGIQALTDLCSGSDDVLRGYFAITLSGGAGDIHHGFVERMRQRPSTTGSGSECNLEKDNSGNFLWAGTPDGNTTAPLICVGDDHRKVSFWASYAYDAAYAIAYALHDLIEIQNKTEVVGSELLDALTSRVRFEGVTGIVDFYDASGDSDRLYHGDRRVGVSYELHNFKDTVQRLVWVGSWTPCSSGGSCSWSERWQPAPDAHLTFSTADNSQPPQVAPSDLTVVRIGVLLPMFNTEALGSNVLSWSPRVGAFHALREVNNKSDGIVDHLLPNTQLQIAYRDSKCDSGRALTAALDLTRDTFSGAGVSAIVGAGCSGASKTAATVAAASYVPIISPSSRSEVLSDGLEYPYFLRTCPAHALSSVAMVDVLRHLFSYSRVALVTSGDAYGTAAARAFGDAAFSANLVISASVNFLKDEISLETQYHQLLRSKARVIVLLAETSEVLLSPFICHNVCAWPHMHAYPCPHTHAHIHVHIRWFRVQGDFIRRA